MNVRALVLAIIAAFVRPHVEAREAHAAIATQKRERGRFHGRLRGSIKSERGVSRGLHLLSQLSRMGRG
jgi:hypothetical protein